MCIDDLKVITLKKNNIFEPSKYCIAVYRGIAIFKDRAEGSFISAHIGTILTLDYLEVGTLSSGPSIVFIYLHMFEDSSPGVDPEISEKGG